MKALALGPRLQHVQSVDRLRELSAFALDAATLEEFIKPWKPRFRVVAGTLCYLCKQRMW